MAKYLGLDLSLSSTGVAIVEIKNKKPKLIHALCIKTDPKKRHGLRLHTIASKFEEIIDEYGPFDECIKEQGFHRFIRSTQTLFKVHGVTDLIFRNKDPIEYSPTTIKTTLTGNKKASKEEVEQAVRRILKLPKAYKFESDDASDATAVVLTHLIKNKLIREGK